MLRSKYGSVAVLSLVVSLALVNCGGGGGGGGGTPTAPSIAQMGGVWSGVQTLTSVTGCGCVGAVFQTVIGLQANFTEQISQNGSTITSRSTNNETGLWCDGTGTVGSENFTLNATRCATEGVRLTCANGNKRDVFLVSASAQGTVFGNSASGTGAETWNCYNSINGADAGVLTLQYSFQMTRG